MTAYPIRKAAPEPDQPTARRAVTAPGIPQAAARLPVATPQEALTTAPRWLIPPAPLVTAPRPPCSQRRHSLLTAGRTGLSTWSPSVAPLSGGRHAPSSWLAASPAAGAGTGPRRSGAPGKP